MAVWHYVKNRSLYTKKTFKQADQSLCYLYEETLGPQLPIDIERTTKTDQTAQADLPRQIILLVLSWGGSNDWVRWLF